MRRSRISFREGATAGHGDATTRLGFLLTPPRSHFGDAPTFDFDHFKPQVTHFEGLANVRHPSEVREQIAADGFEPLALDVDVQPLAHFIDADLAAEDEAAVAFIDDRIALD